MFILLLASSYTAVLSTCNIIMSLNAMLATNPTEVLGPSGHMEMIFQGTIGSLAIGRAYEQHLGL